MPEPNNRDDPDFDEASSTLNDGLKSCRAVVWNYRALLSQELVDEQLEAHDAVQASNDA